MTKRDGSLLMVALALLIGAGAYAFHQSSKSQTESADFPEGLHWLCLNENCGAAFTTTMDEWRELHAADPDVVSPVCPQCGEQRAARATKCPHCSGHYLRAERRGDKGYCPLCGEELKPLGD